MIKSNETWTRTHDLALVYVALAYGTDNALSDEEVDTIMGTLQKWEDNLTRENVQEIVLEAIAIYMQESASIEVTRTIRTLSQSLSEKERKQALEDVVEIAEADGVLLTSESSLITSLAEIWGIKADAQVLLEQTTATVADDPSWSLLHDMSLICIVLAHSTDNDLANSEINAILERLHHWQPDLGTDELRKVVSEALSFYSSQPDQESLEASVKSIKKTLPPIQRIAFLDDLTHIAHADGVLNDNEKEMIVSLSVAWGVEVKI
ncbi:MAG: TerB family tellurite resistance protein [Rhodothermales bacterium]